MSDHVEPRYGTIVLDVDSTVSAIEGVDWLAERRNARVAAEIRVLTERAMNGTLPLEAVYAHRLALILPTREEIAALSEAYIAAVQPGARALCAVLHSIECEVLLLSGGLRDAILPLAAHLGVPANRVHAVEVEYDADGVCVALRENQPLTTAQGKPIVLHGMLDLLDRPVVMVGDGATDAAVRGVTDAFIAYTGVVRRPAVVAVADAEASDFAALHRLLFQPAPA